MKILFAIKRLESAAGGAERVLANIACGLSERGHDISVLSFDPPDTPSFYPLSPQIQRLHIPVGDPSGRSGFLDTLHRLPALRKAVAETDPDIVIGFMHSMFVPMALALIGTGYPLIASEHIVPAHYRTRRIEFLLLIVSAFLARCVTVVSEQVRDLYPAFLRSRLRVIPNPVDPVFTLPPDQSRSGSKIILSVGRLDPQKAQDILIESFALLAPDFPGWTLRLVGEGPLRPFLEEKISKLSLSNRVFLPGSIQNIANEYARAALFVMPSRYESFGLTTAEAMASGLPVIGFTDCPGTNRLISDGTTGILVPERTPQALAQALASLMRNESERQACGLNGFNQSVRFHPESACDLWERLIEKETAPQKKL